MTTASTTISTVIYKTRSCTRCPILTKRLKKMGLAPTSVYIDEDDAAYATITEGLKLTQVPVTIITGLYDAPIYFDDISPAKTMKIKKTMNEIGTANIEVVAATLDSSTGLPEGMAVQDLERFTID